MWRFPPLYQSARTVLRGFGRQTEKFKLTQDHFEVDRMIVGDQQPRRGCPRRERGRKLIPLDVSQHSCWPRFAEAQMDGEPSALAWRGLHPNVASHQLGEPADDREAKAGAAKTPRRRTIG